MKFYKSSFFQTVVGAIRRKCLGKRCWSERSRKDYQFISRRCSKQILKWFLRMILPSHIARIQIRDSWNRINPFILLHFCDTRVQTLYFGGTNGRPLGASKDSAGSNLSEITETHARLISTERCVICEMKCETRIQDTDKTRRWAASKNERDLSVERRKNPLKLWSS